MPETLNESQSSFAAEIQSVCDEISRLRSLDLSSADQTKRVRELSQRAGIWSYNHPVDLGGCKDRSVMGLVALHDTIASQNLSQVPGLFGPTPRLLANAKQPLRSTHLGPYLRGDKQAAFGFTEPDDAESPTCATITGDTLVVNGQKSYVTSGHTADFINTLVDIEDFGSSMVVIDRHADGVRIEKVFSSSDGSNHAYISFTNVHVPMFHIVGKPGEGLPRAMHQITETRMVLAAQSAGLARWVCSYVSDHIQAPHRSGRPLASREGVRLRYADMRIKAYAMRSMVYRTARIADSGQNSVNEAIASKVFCTETIGTIVDTAIQLVGGNALRVGHPLEKTQRLVRSWRLAEGASDILRLNLARGHLDLSKGSL